MCYIWTYIKNRWYTRRWDFVNIYNSYLERKYKNEEIYQDLLAYYVQSDFLIKLINKVENDALIGFIENRKDRKNITGKHLEK